jgi:hypothetical protein
MNQIQTLVAIISVAIVIYIVTGGFAPKWIPHYEQYIIDAKNNDIYPNVDFDSLVDCQQYLHYRFGNI